MEIPKITPMPPQPQPNDNRISFSQKAFKLWSWLGDNIKNFNAIALFAHDNANSARDSAEKAKASEVVTENAKDIAVSSTALAKFYKEEVERYVIPTQATYSKDEFDKQTELIISLWGYLQDLEIKLLEKEII